VREPLPQEPRRHLVPVQLAERGSTAPVAK
jgi:hypothetical protein